jgi:hypothetical protein
MTPQRKDDLRALLNPWLRSPSDILGREDLEALLDHYPQVESRNYKLWLTSTAVLQRVLHNEILSRTEGYLEDLQHKARIFVQNDSYPIAHRMLEEHHVCIISGAPGVGKTTLAEMLLIHYVSQDFEPVVISSDIGEASVLYRREAPQIFLYDDFLGRTASLEKLTKNEDDRLLRLIHRIGRSSKKRLLLTTREYIMEQAKTIYERLDRPEFIQNKYILDMSDYTRLHRAEILYNHLYFSGVSEGCKQQLLRNNRYLQLIDHPNYSPRVVVEALDLAVARRVSPKDFVAYLQMSLDDPSTLWSHIFNNQIEEEHRVLLVLALTLQPHCRLIEVERSFIRFWRSKLGPHNFSRALQTLETTFLHIRRVNGQEMIEFANPGVQDFIVDGLEGRDYLVLPIIQAAVVFEQCAILWNYSLLSHADASTGIGRVAGGRKVSAATASANSPTDGTVAPAYPGLRRTLVEHADELIEALGRLLTVAVDDGVTLERRLSVLLAVAVDLNVVVEPATITPGLKALSESWRGGIVDKQSALETLERLQRHAPGHQLVNSLLITASSWFNRSLKSTKDFQYLIVLRELLTHHDWPGTEVSAALDDFPDDNDLELEFLWLVQNEIRELLRTAESSHDLASGLREIEDMAIAVGVDVDTELEDGWDTVTQMEMIEDSEADLYQGAPAPNTAMGTDEETARIADMFSTLHE